MTKILLLIGGSSTFEGIVELLGLFAVFILILVLAYFTSRWIGKQGGVIPARNPNMQVVETLKLSQTKYIQIIKVADKYIVMGISKDNMEYITEISKDELVKPDSQGEMVSFKDILTRVKPHTKSDIGKGCDTFGEILDKKHDKDE